MTLAEQSDLAEVAIEAHKLGLDTAGRYSQALFQSLFDHQPKIDNRTPAEVDAGLSVIEANELRG